jgi:hypothetical protein
MYRRWAWVTFMVALAACHSARGDLGPTHGPTQVEPDATLRRFVLDAPELRPAVDAIEDVLGEGASFANLTWSGVNPVQSNPSALRLFVIDARVMAQKCHEPGAGAEQCALAAQIDGSCASIGHQVIGCDASFLLLLYSFATFQTTRHVMNARELGSCKTACWDDFFTSSYAPTLDKQLAVAKHQIEFNGAAPLREDTMISLHGFLMLVLWHELGHVVLRSTGDSLASENAADDFAISHYGKVEPGKNPQYMSLFLFEDFLYYYDSVAMLKAGMNGGRRTGAAPPTPSQRAIYNRELTAQMCSLTHPSPGARADRMSNSPQLASVPRTDDFEAAHRIMRQFEMMCSLGRTAAEHSMDLNEDPGGGPAVTSQWNWPKIEVKLIDPGGAKRSLLRYKLRAGTRQLVHVEQAAHQSTPTVTRFKPSELPDVSSDARLVVAATNVGSLSEIETEILRATSTIRNGIHGEAMRVLQASRVLSKLSPNGHVPEQRLHATGVKLLHQMLMGLPTTQLGTIVLPDQPVGRGAKWTVTQPMDGFIATAVTVTTFTVDAIEGDHLKVTAIEATTQVKPSQPDGQGFQFVGMQYDGTASYDIDLGKPAPAFTKTTTLTTKVIYQGTPIESTTTVTVVQTVAPSP